MTESLFTSMRDFRIWLYTVSHSTLLLRSTKIPGAADTRIDVVFKPVRGMNIPASFAGLDIQVMPSSDPRHGPALDMAERGSGENVFALRWSGGEGWVVAATIGWHEDEGEYYDASRFSVPRLSWSEPG